MSKSSARLLAVMICLFFLSSVANVCAQGKLAHLKSWEGKYPTYNRSSKKFFRLLEIARPLRRLLSKEDFYLLTEGHTKETPFRVIDNYLKVTVCGSPDSYACDHQTIFVINLLDDSIHVAFDVWSGEPRYYSSKGRFTDLPEKIQSRF
jgi:hypothetical protein